MANTRARAKHHQTLLSKMWADLKNVCGDKGI